MSVDVLSVSKLGWGTEAKIQPGSSFWFHLPLPTPVIVDAKRYQMTQFYLLFNIEGRGRLNYVHLWDGGVKVADKYVGKTDATLGAWGNHTGIDPVSTFKLLRPRSWFGGAGISFNVSADQHDGGGFID